MKMKKLLSLLKTLSTTFVKSSICAMKKQRNLLTALTPVSCGSRFALHFVNKLLCNHVLGLQQRVRKEGLLATNLEVKQSYEFLNKPLG